MRTQNAELAAEVAELSRFWRVTQRAEELGMVQAKPQARDFVPFVRGSCRSATDRRHRHMPTRVRDPAGEPISADHRLRLVIVTFGDRLRSGHRAGDRAPGRRRTHAALQGSGAAAGRPTVIPVSEARSATATGCRWPSRAPPGRSWPDPAEIEDPAATAAYIAQKLGYTKKRQQREQIDRLLPSLTAEGVDQAIVLRQIDPSLAEEILAERPPGLFAVDEPRRDYPFSRLAAQLIGYTDIEPRVGQTAPGWSTPRPRF